MTENRVESLDDEFAVAATVMIAGIVNQKVKRERNIKGCARHFLAWNRTVF